MSIFQRGYLLASYTHYGIMCIPDSPNLRDGKAEADKHVLRINVFQY